MSHVARGWRRARQREGRRRGAPCGADELGDAVEPVLVEVIDRAVAQELVRHEERDVHGTRNRPGSAMEWRCGRPAAPMGAARTLAARSPPGRWRRWRQETENDEVAPDGSRLSNAGSEGSSALSLSAASIRHGDDGAAERRVNGREATAHPYLACQMSDLGFRQNP